MLETWNPRLEVVWTADDKVVLDTAVLLSQNVNQASYVSDVLLFLYQHSAADVIMICQKSSPTREMKILRMLYQGQVLPMKASYPIDGTPCANVNRHGVLYFASGVRDRFPLDNYLRNYGIESYFGAPLMNSADELTGVVALLHKKSLPNPYLLELLLTILSPSLESLLERLAPQATA
ncbi:GAF domain-containing protein [Rufibacter hautae]|uniref:GAF domain-containing protein n=1 Tax=Rufibacter hautae TaxID=2595005 RepID=A0A5B6THL9_9BACT|nr:GAF domain-containing protein [Rufibacter hautae]KAA3439486.1 GAF domain-containing protein [Rufibacter hautae]